MTISASTQAMTRSAISMPLQLRWFGFADTNCEIEKKAQFNFSSTLLIIYINFIYYIAIALLYIQQMYILYIHHVEIVCLYIYVMLLPPPVCECFYWWWNLRLYGFDVCSINESIFFCFVLLSFLRIICLVMFFTSSILN